MRTRVLPFPSSSSVLAKPGAEGAPRGAEDVRVSISLDTISSRGLHDFRPRCGHWAACWAPPPHPAPPQPTWVPEWDWQSQGHSVPLRDGALATFRTPPLPYTPAQELQWVGLELTIHLTSQDPGWGIRQVGGPT